MQKTSQPLRLGVLAAAAINWSACFDPIESHPDVVLVAIAARSLQSAKNQISKYSLPDIRPFGSYDELIADPDIDIIYTALPNGLHVKWALAAMKAGKHIIVEKPIASTANEIDLLKTCSRETGKVVMEAIHWRFHPVAYKVRDLIHGGKYGAPQSFSASMTVPRGAIDEKDIRFQYDLAGGTSMDCCYVISGARFFWNAGDDLTFEVESAVPRIHSLDPKVDEAMDAKFVLKSKKDDSKFQCSTHADLSQPKMFGLVPKYWEATPSCTIELEKARIDVSNYVGPHLNHSITIKGKNPDGTLSGKSEVLHAFDGKAEYVENGEKWWTSYRYQWETFVGLVRKAQEEPIEEHLKLLDEAKQVLSIVDAIYEKAGLPLRKSQGLE